MGAIRGTSSLALLAVVLLGVLAAACADSRGPSDASDANGDGDLPPEFLATIADAEEAGVKPFWLGKEFPAQSSTFELGFSPSLDDQGEQGTSLRLEYSTSVGEGFVAFTVVSYSADAGAGTGAERLLIAQSDTSKRQDLDIGPWPARLYTESTATRPVNHLALFLDADESIVVIQTGAGRSGVPGDDPNPLIDAELFLQVVERNLRPYPE